MIPDYKDHILELARIAQDKRGKFVEATLEERLTPDDLELFRRYRQLCEYFSTIVVQLYQPNKGLYRFGVKVYDTEYFYDEKQN